ncbi:MAG TPA: hypothetical protein DCF93_04360 [Desulfuromonas sp.]|nr:hypothetical protein [Desulfuromonas sp.]
MPKMSFAGDLEHLPIVDVIQLLHATKKSGTLHLRSQKGESQLVFQDGFIVSANHLNNSVRIGQVLMELGTLPREALEAALQQQQGATERRPLIAMLIEGGQISKADAFKGLELLIELTIVDVLNWERGTFTLDMDEILISEEYNYFPATLKESITLNTQNILMDALRIFDERRRDGVVEDTTVDDDELALAFGPGTPLPTAAPAPKPELSAEDLGLDALDALERKIPAVFSGIKDYDPINIHRHFVRQQLGDFPVAVQDQLLAVLIDASRALPLASGTSASGRALILYGHDEFLHHLLQTLGKKAGTFVFATDDASNLDLIIGQSLAKDLPPVLVFTAPSADGGNSTAEKLIALMQEKMTQYPRLAVLQLVPAGDLFSTWQALAAGVRAVFPRPPHDPANGAFLDEINALVRALLGYLHTGFAGSEAELPPPFAAAVRELAALSDPAQIAFVLLAFVARHYARAVTFVVARGELVAERSFGCQGGGKEGGAVLKLRLPLGRQSLVDQVMSSGACHYAAGNDPLLTSTLYPVLGSPPDGKVLLLPLRSAGRVIALIYADGARGVAPPDLLEMLAIYAGQQVEIAACRKKFEKSA